MFASGKYVQTADDWRVFESTEGDGNLTLEERKASQKSGELLCSTPKDRMTTVCHLEAVADRYRFFFGRECPVVAYLAWYAQKVSRDPTVAAWKDDHWLAFNWHIHVALRRVWTDCDNGIGKDQLAYLTRIQADLNSGRKFPIEDCPPELRGTRKRDAAQAGLTNGGGGSESGKEKSKDPKSKDPPVSRKSPIADNFAALLKSAKAASKNKSSFHLGKILPKAADFNYMLGDAFKALVQSGDPCGKFYLSKCTQKDCRFFHDLKSNPEKPVIEAMVKRFQEKVDAYVAAEAAKE